MSREQASRLQQQIAGFIAAEGLPADYAGLAQAWFVPLADWLGGRRFDAPGQLLVGVHGAQGTGKSTLCKLLELLLAAQGCSALTLSLDDFYLGREMRQRLARQVHPLLATRGVPGTHDTVLLGKTLDALGRGEAVQVPRFDKARDDLEPESRWPLAQGPFDVVLLEGWCIGCRPQPGADLETPINALESTEDSDGRWRRYVNDRLAQDYATLFARLDCLVMLQAPSLQAVIEWRTLQERKLAARATAGSELLPDAAIERFVQHFERLTRHGLADLPGRADYLLRLGVDHGVLEARAS